MTIVQINIGAGSGSTGRIMCDLHDVIKAHGHQCYMVSGYASDHQMEDLHCATRFADSLQVRKDLLLQRITGTDGYRYKRRTEMIIRWIDDKKPDILHLHNLHNNWLHVPTLFAYIKEKNVPVVWTLHDCWGFTGRCSHFEAAGCFQWKDGCRKCPKEQKKVYPITYFFDFSKRMWAEKKAMFTAPDRMTLVTPSEWLRGYVEQSYLGKYPVRVIPNGIDLSVFYPREVEREKKKIILGVAASWDERKGMRDFFKIDEKLDHEKYQVVLVGLNEKQMRTLPKTIRGIRRTNSADELAELYSKADVFVNPTYQDNYPTVNLEALACGTPVVTYRTGGSPESVPESVGRVVEKGDRQGLFDALTRIVEKGAPSREVCAAYARENFGKNAAFEKYVALYEELNGFKAVKNGVR